eukprot:535811_1
MTTKNDTSVSDLLKNYAAAEMTADYSILTDGDKKALQLLQKASILMDHIYMEQKSPICRKLLAKLQNENPESAETKCFLLNMGPWDILSEEAPFIEGVGPKKSTANFYPEDLTKEEWNEWIATLSKEKAEEAKGFFTVIRRDSESLVSVPYSVEYAEWLKPAAELLVEAAEFVSDESLADFLRARATAFLSNEYEDSEVKWMKVNPESPLEVTIGPYEVYEDNFLAQKAAFESCICVRDLEGTKKLDIFKQFIRDLEMNLPVADKYKNPDIKVKAPIVAVDEVCVALHDTGGDANCGPMTLAFNLPNIESVSNEYGNKLTMLRNVHHAKFDKIMKPVADLLIHPSQRDLLLFESFFTECLCHEVSHSLGPHHLVDDRSTTVRLALGELHSALEEAKADVVGLLSLHYLITKTNALPSNLTLEVVYVNYLVQSFRSMRFGVKEAHGKSNCLQVHFIMEQGGYVFNESDGTWSVVVDKMPAAISKLATKILEAQGDGDKVRVTAMFDTYAKLNAATDASLKKLKDASIPIDINPVFDATF